MRIDKIQTNKKEYLDMLLLADEQESMLDKYTENLCNNRRIAAD